MARANVTHLVYDYENDEYCCDFCCPFTACGGEDLKESDEYTENTLEVTCADCLRRVGLG